MKLEHPVDYYTNDISTDFVDILDRMTSLEREQFINEGCELPYLDKGDKVDSLFNDIYRLINGVDLIILGDIFTKNKNYTNNSVLEDFKRKEEIDILRDLRAFAVHNMEGATPQNSSFLKTKRKSQKSRFFLRKMTVTNEGFSFDITERWIDVNEDFSKTYSHTIEKSFKELSSLFIDLIEFSLERTHHFLNSNNHSFFENKKFFNNNSLERIKVINIDDDYQNTNFSQLCSIIHKYYTSYNMPWRVFFVGVDLSFVNYIIKHDSLTSNEAEEIHRLLEDEWLKVKDLECEEIDFFATVKRTSLYLENKQFFDNKICLARAFAEDSQEDCFVSGFIKHEVMLTQMKSAAHEM